MAPALPTGETWLAPGAALETVIGEIGPAPGAALETVIGETWLAPGAALETVIGEIGPPPGAELETVIGRIGPPAEAPAPGETDEPPGALAEGEIGAPLGVPAEGEIGPLLGTGAGAFGPWGFSSAGAGSALAAGFSGSEGFSVASAFGDSVFGDALLATASGSAFSSAAGRTAGLVGSPVAALRSESGSGTSLPPQPTHDKQTPAIARRPNHAPIDLMAAILYRSVWSQRKTDSPNVDPEVDFGSKDEAPADPHHSMVGVL